MCVQYAERVIVGAMGKINGCALCGKGDIGGLMGMQYMENVMVVYMGLCRSYVGVYFVRRAGTMEIWGK